MKSIFQDALAKKIIFRCIMLVQKIVNKLNFISSRMGIALKSLSIDNRNPPIFIISYPKSGTTWLQMILYQLTTDGNMDNITHIMDIYPHLENNETNPKQIQSAHVIKTHLSHKFYWMFKGKGKYIYIMRDGLDVAVSMYHHWRNYYNYPGTFEEFYQAVFLSVKAPYSWFRHISYWLKEKNNPNFLFIHYEDMKKDLESVIRDIINFCEFDVKEENIARILERSSFKFMKQHEEKFDLGIYLNFRISGMYKKTGEFIRKGESDYSDTFQKEQLISYQEQFSKYLGGKGLECYSKVEKI